MTEPLTTRQAAERLGISVARFHQLVLRARVDPAIKAPGVRGAMFWDPAVIDDLRPLVEDRAAS